MAINKLIFDTTDANSIADSHHVGAHTLSGTGALITSGDGDSDNIANTFEGLDTRSFLYGYDVDNDNWDRLQLVKGAAKVYIDGGDFTIDVALNGVYDVGDNPTPDNVGLIAHVRNAAPGDAQQTFRSTGGAASSDDVVAANVFGLDVNSFGMVFDGTTWDRVRGTNGAMNVSDGGTPLTVTDSALANTAITNAAQSLAVANTAQALISSPLANRKYLLAYNNDNRVAYIGATGVSAANGFPVPVGSLIELRAGAAVAIEWVSAKASHDLRTLELA